MSLLFRYLAREMLWAIALAALALVSLFSLFDFIHEVTDVGGEHWTTGIAGLYVALNAPARFYEVLPVSVLVGGLFAWNRLALSSEFSVMRTAGLSAPKLAAWMVVMGLAVGSVGVLVGEYVTPPAERAAQQLKLRASKGVVAREFQTGVWAKDGHSFINIQDMRPDGSLADVRIYMLDGRFHLLAMRRAEYAEWHNGSWTLRRVKETRIGEGRTATRNLADQVWNSAVTPDLLSVLMLTPQRMSMSSLYTYIRHLTQNRQDAHRYVLALWGKLTYPLAAPVMLLLALAFAYRPPRVGGTGGRMLVGILLGLGFHLGNRMSSQIAQLQDWPAPLSVSAPLIVFGLAAGGFIWWMERR